MVLDWLGSNWVEQSVSGSQTSRLGCGRGLENQNQDLERVVAALLCPSFGLGALITHAHMILSTNHRRRRGLNGTCEALGWGFNGGKK